MTPNPIGELMQECDEAAEQYFHGLSDVPPEPYSAFRNAILDAFKMRKFVREGAAERVRGMRVIRIEANDGGRSEMMTWK